MDQSLSRSQPHVAPNAAAHAMDAPDVYTADEVARAANTSSSLVRLLIASGDVATVDGVHVTHREAVRIARRLRSNPRPSVRHVFGEALLDRSVEDDPAASVSVAMSTTLHGVVALVAALVATAQLTTAADEPVLETGPRLTRLVFMSEPGPGGGGGGGGLRSPLPPLAAERRGADRVSSPVPPRVRPTVVEPPPEPEPPEPLKNEELPRIVAPLVEARADVRDIRGLLDRMAPAADESPTSLGAGTDGGVGTGSGQGVGEGRGAGVGPGTGGGTGGGAYRPGSGVSPPAIAEEIKPDYTEEARRQRIEGDVVLEVIVLSDGSVGSVRIVRGLGYGLDESAVRAMRRWRFHPAQRHGEAVDVVVEVAMEFRLR